MAKIYKGMLDLIGNTPLVEAGNIEKDQELEALSWKSDELGISYGKLVSQSSPEEIRQYYGEYERRLERRQRKGKQLGREAGQ